VLHVESNLDKGKADRQSLDNGEGARLFRRWKCLLSAMEDAFALKIEN